MHPTLPRCALQGQPFGCPDSLPANPSNPRGVSTLFSPPDTQNAPSGALCVSGGESGTKRAKPYAIYLPTELRPGCVLVSVPEEYARHIKKCNVTSDSSELRRRGQGAVADKNGASLHFMKSPALLELLSGCS
jgi:hypothetical protein